MTTNETQCSHTRNIRVKRDSDEEDESPVWEWEEVSTLEDIDTGRMRCSLCGKIEYYTGQWRDFWEKGKPCLGSEKFNREERESH